MAYKNVLLEAYCGYEYREEVTKEIPEYCKNGIDNPGYHCFDNECPFRSYTYSPNAIVYVNEFGEVIDQDSYIGFGGEMQSEDEVETEKLLDLWEEICKRKIEEAYTEFIEEKNDIIKGE